jgi:O-antigen ligase
MSIILTLFIFTRPFISSLAFPYLNSAYSFLLCAFIILWIALKGVNTDFLNRNKEALALLALSFIISVAFSNDFEKSLKELLNYATYIPIMLICSSLNRGKRNLVIDAILASAVIISLLGIYQYFSGFNRLSNYIADKHIVNPFVLDYLSRKRVFFPFVTPNAMGGFLAMLLPLTFTIRKPIPFIITTGLALILTESLGALFAAFIAVAVFFYFTRRSKKLILFAVLAWIVKGTIIFILRSTTVKVHTSPGFSWQMRLDYIKGAVDIIKKHPFAGVGPGNFNLINSRYAHNSVLQLWSEFGVFGVFATAWLIISIIRTCLKTADRTTFCLLAGSSAFLIHNLFDFTFFLPEVSLIWWAIMGLMDSSARQRA